MITDRMTAMVLGYLVFVMTALIDVSCFIFARPETRSSPRFAVVVAVTSVPLLIAGALFIRKGASMKKEPGER